MTSFFAMILYALQVWFTVRWAHVFWAFAYVPIVIAVMLAAQGVTWGRKLLFVFVTLGLQGILVSAANLTGLTSVATAPASAGGTISGWALTSAVVLQVLVLGLPIAALALFVGRRPSVLWSAGAGGSQRGEKSH